MNEQERPRTRKISKGYSEDTDTPRKRAETLIARISKTEEMEEWRECQGWEGYYVSNSGRLISSSRIRKKATLRKPIITPFGYITYGMFDGVSFKTEFAHKLVAKEFIPNPNNYPQVNHIDGVKTNSHVSNLEWCTQSQNQKHAFMTGLQKPIQGINHYASKLSEEDVILIRKLRKENVSLKELCSGFGIKSQGTMSMIARGIRWKHVPESDLPIEKWLEVYLRLVNLKRPERLEVPRLPLKYPEGQE